MKDYVPITDTGAAGLLGEWWRQPPHVIREETYMPYRGEGAAPSIVKADVLVPGGKRIARYDPNAEAGLLNAALDVAQVKLKPAHFADRFGLLGYNYVVPRVNVCKGGDPLNWFLAQVSTVRVAAELIERLAEAHESIGGRRFLADYLKDEIPDGPYALGGWVTELRFQQSSRSPILVANGILRYLLNANLGETGRRIQIVASGPRTVFTFRALIEVIYWQLADLMDKSAIRRCVECGRIFTGTNSRIRFCPPASGQTISPCKSRFNVRLHRKGTKPRRKK
jgi:hypothetical protein